MKQAEDAEQVKAKQARIYDVLSVCSSIRANMYGRLLEDSFLLSIAGSSVISDGACLLSLSVVSE